MSSQIARKLDPLATVNPFAVTVVYTEGCAKTVTETRSACESDSISVIPSVTSIMKISYLTLNTGKMGFCYTSEKISWMVSSSIVSNCNLVSDAHTLMLRCPTSFPPWESRTMTIRMSTLHSTHTLIIAKTLKISSPFQAIQPGARYLTLNFGFGGL